MKKRLLRRVIITYILFCVIGFAVTSWLTSRNHLPFLHVAVTPDDLQEYFSTGYYRVCLTICIAALLILFVTVFFICRPLKRIVRGAAAYADGNYKTQISLHAGDEIGFIADVMDGMAFELDSLEEDQRKFISNISHDFRSPLTSIKGYAEAIADGTIPVDSQEKYLNIIISETERLEKLTQSLLDLNKFSAKGAFLNLAAFDINEVIRHTVLTFEGRVSEKNIFFSLRLTDYPLFVKADSAKIEQVLHNLIDNAVKFSNDNSGITIETTAKNGKAFISVKDAGIGIPRDSLNKIWERFYKTDLSRGKDKRGTGLGLSIVREIVHAHHENINVISTEGVGTEFIFSLSLTQPPEQTPRANA